MKFQANFCPASKFLFYGIGNNMRMVAEFPIQVSTSILMTFFKYFTQHQKFTRDECS